jgi:hypothetical protein
MSFVLASSVALAWCFEDERTDATDALLRQVAISGAAAPGLWPLEVLNGLAAGEQRGRPNADQRNSLGGQHEVVSGGEKLPQDLIARIGCWRRQRGQQHDGVLGQVGQQGVHLGR